jgi:protein-tyrosine phosphatase
LVLRGLGGDPEDFSARQLHEELVTAADLVLTMTREHRERVLALSPRWLARTYTLLEAADLLGNLETQSTEGLPIPERARELVKAMASARGRRRVSGRDDVPDPVNRPLKAHQEVGEVIADAMLVVLRRLVGAVVDETTPPRAAHADRRPRGWFRARA